MVVVGEPKYVVVSLGGVVNPVVTVLFSELDKVVALLEFTGEFKTDCIVVVDVALVRVKFVLFVSP